MTVGRVVASGLLIAAVACSRPVPEPNEAARGKLAEAAQLEASGDWNGALAVLDAALVDDPAAPDAALESGALLEKMGFLTEAVAMYETATGRAANDPRGYLQLARIYRANGRAEIAAHSVEAARAVSDDDPDVQLEVGRLLIEKEDLWSAGGMIGSALKARPNDTESLYLFGVVEHRRRAPAEAQALLHRAIARDERHLGAILELSQLLRERDRAREAMQVIDAALKAIDPPPAALLREAAAVLRDRAREAEAEELEARGVERAALEEAIAAGRARLWTNAGEADLRRTLVADLLTAGDEAAEGMARGWLRLEPQSASAWAALARSCVAAEQLPCAAEASARAVELGGVAAEELQVLAGALEAVGMTGAASVVRGATTPPPAEP